MVKSTQKKPLLFSLLVLIFWASVSLAQAPASVDTDRDGVEDSKDLDDDGDSVLDSLDAFPKNPKYSKDSDLDGLPDKWENFYGLNLADSKDASSDTDQDGLDASELHDRFAPPLVH